MLALTVAASWTASFHAAALSNKCHNDSVFRTGLVALSRENGRQLNLLLWDHLREINSSKGSVGFGSLFSYPHVFACLGIISSPSWLHPGTSCDFDNHSPCCCSASAEKTTVENGSRRLA